MTRTRWIPAGAIAPGLAVGVDLLFFCPTDCR